MASVPFTAHFFAEGEREREDEDDGGIGASGVSEREKRLCHCSAVRDDDKNGTPLSLGIDFNASF